MDEQHLYHQEALNNPNYLENDWTETDDAQFVDVSNFDNSEIIFSILPDEIPHLMRDNISQ